MASAEHAALELDFSPLVSEAVALLRDYLTIDTTNLPADMYGLRVVLLDPATLTVLVDQAFADLFSVVAVVPTPPVAPPTAVLSPGDLVVGPFVTPQTAVPGDEVGITVSVSNPTPITQVVVFDVRLLPPVGPAIDLASQVTVRPGDNIYRARWLVPEAAAIGSYGVRIIIIDPTSLDVLVDRDFGTLFSVEAAPVPEPAPAPPPAPIPEEELFEPAPAPVPTAADVAVSIIFEPASIGPGDPEQATLVVQVTNIGNFNFGVSVSANLLVPAPGQDPTRAFSLEQLVVGPELISPTFGLLIVGESRVFRGTFGTSTLPNGAYGASATIRSFQTGEVITMVARPTILGIVR